MLLDIYNEALVNQDIRQIYDKIGENEDNAKGWAYHNFNHIVNVTEIVSKILTSLNYDDEFIIKAKIACLFHDVGALEGKIGHAERSYEYTKKYFSDKNISFDGIDDVLNAIRIHSDGFDTDNMIALALILADKLDVKSSRITEEGKKIIGNRQFTHVEDILIDIKDNTIEINFITDEYIDIKELNEYYFTKKIFKAIEGFSNKLNLNYSILMNGNAWNLN